MSLGLSCALVVLALSGPVAARKITVLCNFEVDGCEALKATYEKTTGQKAVFIRRTDGESLAQIRAERSNPRADIYHVAESASAKQLAAEASATMRAGTFATLSRVVLPLMRPAVIAALGYSFISAMTSISAVIFLTSPRFDRATVNIVGRAEVGEYGYASAYASVLIVLMVVVVLAIRAFVGRRRLSSRQIRADATV